MNAEHRDMQSLLDAVARGELDTLTPDQAALLESALNERPELAEQLAAPGSEALLPPVEAPTAAEWERVWAGIDAGVPRDLPDSAKTRPPVLYRFGLHVAAGVAAAALLVAVFVAGFNRTPEPLQSGGVVEVLQVESSGDAALMVSPAWDEEEFTVIWVFDEQEAT